MLNDISIGIINSDIIRDMCINNCTKTEKQKTGPNGELSGPKPKGKIEMALQTILEQRSLYPIYPSGLNTPVDWDQIKGLMFESPPDILIAPSELVMLAKVIEGTICINPGNICKQNTGGSFASITVDPVVVPNGDRDSEKLFSNRVSDRVRVDIIHI